MNEATATRLAWKNGYRSSHFAPAFLFLAPARRRALSTVYAVFRLLDDAVDKSAADPRPLLAAWRSVFEGAETALLSPFGCRDLGDAFREAQRDFGIPSSCMLDFIEKGAAVDLAGGRFRTPLDTESYCYGVAGTVGIACLPIFGVPFEEAKDFAVRLGIAVQWVNIVRDVGSDARTGRIYLPLDHLELFGVTEQDLRGGAAGGGFHRLMAHEAGVARGHFRRAAELLPRKWERALLPARIMGGIYLKLLEKLEKQNYPVFTRRVGLNPLEKGLATWRIYRGQTWLAAT